MTTLGDDRPAALSSHRIERRPDHAWIEDDRIVAAVLREQDIREQGRDVRSRNELTFFIEEHRPVSISIPRNAEGRIILSHEFFGFSPIAGQHRIGWSFWKRSIR